MSSPETPELDPIEPLDSTDPMDSIDSIDPIETSPRRPAAPVVLAAPPDRVDPLNLSRRPFLNSRPVVRVSLLLWALGLALLIGNVSRFLTYRDRSADKRQQIARGEAEIERQRGLQARLQKLLDNFDLETQNDKIDFLNRKIQERTFSWSALLDRVAERLPHDVRLNRLAPLTGGKAEKEFQRSHVARRAGTGGDQVPLLITGETRKPEALTPFIDSLYKPPFAYPNPSREETTEDGKLLKFELSVQYRPNLPPAAGGAASGPAGPAPRIEELPMPAAPGPGTPGIPGTSGTPPRTTARRPSPATPGGRP
jgi:Tfp pilus assembly protein PilN